MNRNTEMSLAEVFLLVLISLSLMSCVAPQAHECPPGSQMMTDCPAAGAIDDEDTNRLYASRTWVPQDQLTIDPIKLSEEAEVPINSTLSKIIGPSRE